MFYIFFNLNILQYFLYWYLACLIPSFECYIEIIQMHILSWFFSSMSFYMFWNWYQLNIIKIKLKSYVCWFSSFLFCINTLFGFLLSLLYIRLFGFAWTFWFWWWWCCFLWIDNPNVVSNLLKLLLASFVLIDKDNCLWIFLGNMQKRIENLSLK